MGANLGQWEAGTKACCEQSCTESSEFQMLWVCKSRDIHGEPVGTALVLWAGGCPWSAPLLKGRSLSLDDFTSVPQSSLPSNSQHESEASVPCLGQGEGKGLWSVVILLLHHKGTEALNIASVWLVLLLSQSCRCASAPAGLCCQSFYTGGKRKAQWSLLAQFYGVIVLLVHVFAHWSRFEAAFWDLFELLAFREIPPLCCVLVSSHSLDLCSLFPVAQFCLSLLPPSPVPLDW